MLDKFLSKINSATTSPDNTINQKIADYNKDVIAKKRLEPVQKVLPGAEAFFLANQANTSTNKHSKFENAGSNISRPRTYQTFDKQQSKQPKVYIDDGSYFCAYSVGGTTLVCYKDKDKIELVLDGIVHPDKNNSLAKRANYFLNDLVKKKKVYIEEKDNGKYEIFLDSRKEESINQLLISEGFDNSEVQDTTPKKTTFANQSATSDNIKNSNDNVEKVIDDKKTEEKKNYAYGLFATNHHTFEALFDKNKITLSLAELDLENISKDDQKTCKSMIYDFVSKKSIILKFKEEKNGIHFAEVFNKEGECLNNLIRLKNFKAVNINNKPHIKSNDHDDNIVDGDNHIVDNEACSEDDWNWTSSKENSNGNSEDIEVPEISALPAMFKNPIISKPNSPFAQRKNALKEAPVIKSSIEDFDSEVDVREETVLPAMFKNPVVSKPNSPFAINKVMSETKNNNEMNTTGEDKSLIHNNKESIQETIVQKKKLSFGKR